MPPPSFSWPPTGAWRSEEHTSELQSLRHLVCRLLLEKTGIGDGDVGGIVGDGPTRRSARSEQDASPIEGVLQPRRNAEPSLVQRMVGLFFFLIGGGPAGVIFFPAPAPLPA